MAIFNEFPIGKPEILIGPKLQRLIFLPNKGFFIGEQQYFGLMHVTIIPPESMFLPILPINLQGKLKFVLCQKCGETMNPNLCKHNENERSLTSVWTSLEIEFALIHGYKLKKVHEFFSYKATAPIFKNFFTKLAKIKLESEGFPENITDKEEYVKSINDAMPGINLQSSNIQKNEGRRAFAKDMR